MPSVISKTSRRELMVVTGERYRASVVADRRRILTEFVAVTGISPETRDPRLEWRSPRGVAEKSGRARVYDVAVREALVVLWEAADRICGKRLTALLPVLIPALEQHGHLRLHDDVRGRPLAASAATVDRLLAPTRIVAGGRARHPTCAVPGIRRAVPVRTFADWKDPAPGYMEADLVAHCAETVVLQRTRPARLRLSKKDRCLWVMLSRIWTGWRTSLVIVKPETRHRLAPTHGASGCGGRARAGAASGDRPCPPTSGG